ncbi:unnamed protein product, partial [Prorocentrum cordatum]
PPPPPCFNRDPGTNPSVGSVATRVRRVRARLTSALYTPTACGQRPLTQAGGGQGKFRTRLSGLAPPSGPNRRTTMHSYSAERFNDDKNKKTQSVVTALGLASGPQEEGGGGGGGGKWEGVVGDMVPISPPRGGGAPAAARLQHAPLGLPRPRAGALSGRPASCPRARASQRGGQGARRGRAGKRPRMGGGTPPRCLRLRQFPPNFFTSAARQKCCSSGQRSGATERRIGRRAVGGKKGRAAKMPGPGSPAARAGRSLLLGRGDGRGRAAGRWLVGSLRQVTWAMPVSTARRMQYNNLAARHVEQVLPARERRRLAAARPRACGERADGEGLEAEPAPPRGWRGPLQHHLGRTSRSRHAPPRGAARPGEGGGGTVRGAPAAA